MAEACLFQPRLVWQSRNLLRCRGGSFAVEFGTIAPTLILIIFGIIELGRALWTLSALYYAVEEAARCASINSSLCGTADQIKSFAAARSGAGFNTAIFNPSVVSCGNQVSASYPMQLNIPYASRSITLTATFCYPI